MNVIQASALRHVETLALPPGARILDAPSGDGSLVEALHRRGYDARGLDIDPAAAARLGPSFTVADLNGPFPFPDHSFDAVLSIEGIEHLENRFAYLREIHRVLKRGGVLILTTPNIIGVRSRVRFFGSGFYHRDSRPLDESARHPLHHIALATLADFRYALHTSGFRLAAVGHTHIKPVSWLYAWLVPWMWVYTTVAFRKEKDGDQRRANNEVRSAVFSRSVLFGENLLLTAKRD